MTRVDWSRLPDDILRRIVEDYVTRVEDHVRFSGVCRSWYSVVRTSDKSKLRKKWCRQMPLLMLTDGNDTEIYYDSFKRGTSYQIYTSSREHDVTRLFNAREYVKGQDLDKNDYYYSDEDDEDYSEHLEDPRCLLRVGRERNECFKASLPEAYGRACWGSRYGWIVTLGRDRQMCLFNPITKSTLPLPSQSTFPFPWKRACGKTIRYRFIEKAVLVVVPRDESRHKHISRDSSCCTCADGYEYDDGIWLVVALHQNSLLASIAKPGDSSWTPILRPNRRNCYYSSLMDVIYCSRLQSLLFVCCTGDMYICDLSDIEHPKPLRPYLKCYQSHLDGPLMDPSRSYIVESGDDTLIISRYVMLREYVGAKFCKYEAFKAENYREFKSHLTFNFKVFKLNFAKKKLKEVHDLGRVVLFLGNNATIAVCSTYAACEPNSIYFCDDYRSAYWRYRVGVNVGGNDMAVFKMEDKTIRPFYDGHRSKSSYCCPVWFSPSL